MLRYHRAALPVEWQATLRGATMTGPMAGAILHIIGGNDRGKQFELNKPEMRIGRGTDQDVVLADIAVSRRHVTVLMDGQRFRLKDLGSGNGSLVNGQRVDTVILNDGDQIEIGNTLMRFDHAASRPNAPAPAPAPTPAPPVAMPPGYPPPGYPPPGYPPSYPGMAPGYPPPYGAPGPAYPAGYPPPGYPPSFGGGVPGDPSLSASMGMSMGGVAPASNFVSQPSAVRAGGRRGGMSTIGKVLVFGMYGLFSVGGIVAIVSRTVFAQPVVVQNEGEELYRQGLRLFAAGDYELAKTKFTDAANLVKDAPEPLRYARLCDTELAARTSLKNAERALVNRRYTEAVRALDAVESTSVYADQAARQRKDTAPKAAVEMLEDARRLQTDNAEEARNRLKTALELDPNNFDARDLLNRLHGGGPAATPSRAPATNPPPSAATVAAVSREPREPREPREAVRHAATPRAAPPPKGDDDGDLATVKVGKAASASSGPPPDAKAGMAAYKARDFAGAVKLLRAESMKQASEKQALKTLDFANQVAQLQQLVERASGDETKNAAQSVKEYEQAIALDQKLARGMHTAYFKSRIGGLGVQAAKQAFAAGKYEEAYAAAVAAQKGGGDAGALMKQLEQKASELVSQGVSVQKSNVGQAKQYWRTVLHMVPSSSPNYTKAYSLINSASAPKRDEDED